MSEELEKINFKDHCIRVIRHGDELMWCGVDCCKVLDLTNAPKAISKLNEDEKAAVTISYGSQGRHVIFVTEPGLYALIMQSRKPVAREFQRWVCHDVLPSIRRNGSYAMPGSEMNLAMKALDAECRARLEALCWELQKDLYPMGLMNAFAVMRELLDIIEHHAPTTVGSWSDRQRGWFQGEIPPAFRRFWTEDRLAHKTGPAGWTIPADCF